MKWLLTILLISACSMSSDKAALKSTTAGDLAAAPTAVRVRTEDGLTLIVEWDATDDADTFRVESCVELDGTGCEPDSDAWLELGFAMGTKRSTAFHYDLALIPANASGVVVRVSAVLLDEVSPGTTARLPLYLE